MRIQYLPKLGCIKSTYPNYYTELKIVHRNNSVSLKHTVEKGYSNQVFGLQHQGYNNVINGVENNYQTFQGVEHEEALGLNVYEMDFRQYDPAIARWNGIDPILHYEYSPYQAFDNNPIFWSDPSGADGEHYNWETGRYENDKGEEVSFETALASVGVNTNTNEPDNENGSGIGTDTFIGEDGSEYSWDNLLEKFSNPNELKKLEGKKFDKPDPDSFNFKRRGLWQEAATKGLYFNIALVEISPRGVRTTYKHTVMFNQAILFGLPANLKVGDTDISAELAAEMTATVVDRVMSKTSKKFARTTASPMQVEQYFRAELKREYSMYLPGGRVQFNAMNFKGKPTIFRHSWF